MAFYVIDRTIRVRVVMEAGSEKEAISKFEMEAGDWIVDDLETLGGAIRKATDTEVAEVFPHLAERERV